MLNPISREDIQSKLATGEAMTLVEALPAKYFDQGHLPGAVNLPLDQIETLSDEKLPEKSELVVVYCSNTQCNNSRQAAEKLRALGYVNVREYTEGKADWQDAGLKLERIHSD